MEKYGFVYIWYDRKHQRYYVGAHWGTEDDGYICSSSWMNSAYKRRPDDFKRRILERIYTNKKETFQAEDRWLRMISKNELKNKYYNLHNKGRDYWFLHEEISLSVREKISKTKTGIKIHSEEYKERRRQMALGNPGGFGGILGMQGKTHSEETKRKIGKAHKGKKVPPEAIEKMRQKKIGRKRPQHEKDKISKSMKLVWDEERKQKHRDYLNSLPEIKCPFCPKVGKNKGAMAGHIKTCKKKIGSL